MVCVTEDPTNAVLYKYMILGVLGLFPRSSYLQHSATAIVTATLTAIVTATLTATLTATVTPKQHQSTNIRIIFFQLSLNKHHENYGFARSWSSGFVCRPDH